MIVEAAVRINTNADAPKGVMGFTIGDVDLIQVDSGRDWPFGYRCGWSAPYLDSTKYRIVRADITQVQLDLLREQKLVAVVPDKIHRSGWRRSDVRRGYLDWPSAPGQLKKFFQDPWDWQTGPIDLTAFDLTPWIKAKV